MIIDTDGGVDDAIAIMMAHATGQLRAITTVAGNVALPQVNQNVARLLRYIGASVPMYQGAHASLRGTMIDARFVHGQNGFGNVELPQVPVSVQQARVPEAYCELIARYAPVSLVALGPLTNIAMTFLLHPEIFEGVERLVIMGGSLASGNITPTAEFNFFADPEAAHVVLGYVRNTQIVLVPWDTCVRTEGFGKAHLEGCWQPLNNASRLALSMLELFWSHPEIHTADAEGMVRTYLADPIAMAYALDTSAPVASYGVTVDVDTHRGQTRRRAAVNTAGTTAGAAVDDRAVAAAADTAGAAAGAETHRGQTRRRATMGAAADEMADERGAAAGADTHRGQTRRRATMGAAADEMADERGAAAGADTHRGQTRRRAAVNTMGAAADTAAAAAGTAADKMADEGEAAVAAEQSIAVLENAPREWLLKQFGVIKELG